MKRLFTLNYKSGRPFIEDGNVLYFASKPLAKARRDRQNRNIFEAAQVRVGLGPDHDGYGPAPHKRNSRFRRLRGTR